MEELKVFKLSDIKPDLDKEFLLTYFNNYIFKLENYNLKKFLNQQSIINSGNIFPDDFDIKLEKQKNTQILFPKNIRNDIKRNWRIYEIEKFEDKYSGKDKFFVVKFELSGIEEYFIKEGLTESGTEVSKGQYEPEMEQKDSPTINNISPTNTPGR